MRIRQPLTFAALALALAACGTASVFDLAVGDCFNDPTESGGEVSSVTQVECAQPHDNEVYAAFDYAGSGDEFPGSTAMSSAADEGCLERFEAFVGTSYTESEIYYTFLVPTEESWGTGDREVLCVLFIPNEQMEGSMEGSAR